MKTYSGDMPVRAVLDELLRVGAVEMGEDNKIRLLSRGYVPQKDEESKVSILGTDVKDLISTIDHNLSSSEKDSFFQRKVSYDNLPNEALEDFRNISKIRSQEFLEFWDRWLSEHDRDSNPHTKGTQRKRAGLGLYYFEEDLTKGGS